MPFEYIIFTLFIEFYVSNRYKLSMKNIIILFFVLISSTFTFAGETVSDSELVELDDLTIKEIKEYLKTTDLNHTCLDEYMQRRKQVITFLSIMPITGPVQIAGAWYAGGLTGIGLYNIFRPDDPWADLTYAIGGMFFGSLASAGSVVVQAVSRIRELTDLNTIIKSIGESYLNRPFDKMSKMHARFLSKNQDSPVGLEEFSQRLIDFDKTQKLCDGSLIKQPKLKLGTKLKYKVARSKNIFKAI